MCTGWSWPWLTCVFRSVAGFASARMYKVLKGQQWFRNALLVCEIVTWIRDTHGYSRQQHLCHRFFLWSSLFSISLYGENNHHLLFHLVRSLHWLPCGLVSLRHWCLLVLSLELVVLWWIILYEHIRSHVKSLISLGTWNCISACLLVDWCLLPSSLSSFSSSSSPFGVISIITCLAFWHLYSWSWWWQLWKLLLSLPISVYAAR